MDVKFCRFNDDGICTECGVPRSAGAIRNCPAKPWKHRVGARVVMQQPPRQPAKKAVEPGKVRQVASYGKSVAKWELAGRPTRSQEEIERALAICKSCPLYRGNDGRPRCGLCGCSINSLRNGLKNKIAMATEHCPLDPPKW